MSVCLTEPHRGFTRKPHRCFWCGQFLPGNTECTMSSWAGDGTVYTIHECDRCAPFVPGAFEYWHVYPGEQMEDRAFWDYMAEEHPVTWWEWRVEDDEAWLRRVECGRYGSEADREADRRCCTVALEHARKELAKARKAVGA